MNTYEIVVSRIEEFYHKLHIQAINEEHALKEAQQYIDKGIQYDWSSESDTVDERIVSINSKYLDN